MTGFGLGENARAALITRGILEIVRVVVAMVVSVKQLLV